MKTLCTSCDTHGNETEIGKDYTLESCKETCLADDSCLAIDFGKNERFGECYLATQQGTNYSVHSDFDAWTKSNCPTYVNTTECKMTLTCSMTNSCWIKEDGQITCYGSDENYLISTIPKSDRYYFFITSGQWHNCAISSTSHAITCWGADFDNQVSDTPTSGTYNFVSSGRYHNCAISSTSHAITCWGKDASQVSATPTSGTYNFISSGGDHNCAISSTSHMITCWGDDSYNQVSDTPTSGTYNFISSRGFHTCAISSTSHAITCWGEDSFNQVSDTPTSGTYNFISSGFSHNCAISSASHAITCWGRDDSGQVSDTPTSGTYNFISSGSGHNCAISSTSHVITCWGADYINQVSDANLNAVNFPALNPSCFDCSNTLCNAPLNECYVSPGTCWWRSCSYNFKTSGAPCTGGTCNGEGTCDSEAGFMVVSLAVAFGLLMLAY